MNRFQPNYDDADRQKEIEDFKRLPFVKGFKNGTKIQGLPLGEAKRLHIAWVKRGKETSKEIYDPKKHAGLVDPREDVREVYAINFATKIEGEWVIKYFEMKPSQNDGYRRVLDANGLDFEMLFSAEGDGFDREYHVQVVPKTPITNDDRKVLEQIPIIEDLARAAVDAAYLDKFAAGNPMDELDNTPESSGDEPPL